MFDGHLKWFRFTPGRGLCQHSFATCTCKDLMLSLQQKCIYDQYGT